MHIATVKSPDWDKTMDELNGIVYWTNNTTNNHYSFNNFDRRGPFTAKFMKFVESCEKYGKSCISELKNLKCIFGKCYGFIKT